MNRVEWHRDVNKYGERSWWVVIGPWEIGKGWATPPTVGVSWRRWFVGMNPGLRWMLTAYLPGAFGRTLYLHRMATEAEAGRHREEEDARRADR